MKTKSILLIILSVLMYINGFTQTVISAQAIAGGSDYDNLSKLVIPKNKDGVLVAGYSASNHSSYKTEDSRGGADYWVVKYSRNKNNGTMRKEWDKTIGGNLDDILKTAVATSDSGYLLAGYSYSGKSGEKTDTNNGKLNYWLVKLDRQGNIQWDKTIGPATWPAYGQWLNGLDQTKDGGYILVGSDGSNAKLTKVDRFANVQWEKIYSSPYFSSVRITTDGGYIIGGSDSRNEAALMVKTDSLGNIQWQTTSGRVHHLNVFIPFTKALQTKDGGYILTEIESDSGDDGYGNFYPYDYVWRIMKYDAVGNLKWSQSAALGSSSFDFGIEETRDSDLVVAMGRTGDEAADYYLRKIDKTGNLKWDKYIGGDESDYASDILQITADKYLVGGRSFSGISGDKTKLNLGKSDYWVLAITDTTATNTSINSIASSDAKKKEIRNDLLIYPNPAKDILHIETKGEAVFTLTNQSGKILLTKTITNKGEINVANLAAGLYYLKNNATGAVQKVVVTK